MEGIPAKIKDHTGKAKQQSCAAGTLKPDLIAKIATESLLAELEAYPKPGMVSYVDNGSHSDMNAATFERSIEALTPYWTKLYTAGTQSLSLSVIRQTGIDAESKMLEATNGINTHKGAIFAIGLLVTAAGMEQTSRAGKVVSKNWANKLLKPSEFTPLTNGSKFYRQHGIKGARGEAANGFPSIYECGLPAYRKALQVFTPQVAAIHSFYAMLEKVQDTTLLHRGGLDGLIYAKKCASAFNSAGGVFAHDWKKLAIQFHQKFIKLNLSAGGVADLLAATIFLDKLEALQENWK
ncbi:MAG: triphosphoribosyl-dephospho-CoA synthase MdcB [Lentisphaerae bacterium]|nr:triphosphoribosyl-dephospho-CoA synthase MdcB [Lentisphaerota bacterium]MCP4103363.1 triphosphoribosyl-dephospho-CoA synthase MdcB [Lentisphaerota bacterium]